jgi:hypothetical protein
LVEWNVELLSAQEMKKQLASKELAQTHKEDLLRDHYHCIVNGWGYKEGACKFSGASVCNLGCGCNASAGWAAGGHMEKHVLKLLALVDAKTITKPASPPFPDIRQNTTIKLGEETWGAEARREARQRIWAECCKGVAEDPESFSPAAS